MTDYIYDKFNKDKFCIDYDDYLYKFQGFSNNKDLNEFINYDFRDDIRGLFPNYASLVIEDIYLYHF